MSEDQPPIITVPVPPSTGERPLDANSGLGPDVSNLIAAAAQGDLTAQRYLRDSCFGELRRPTQDLPNRDHLACYAIFTARMAASRGGYEDLQRLALTLVGAGAFFGLSEREGVARALSAEGLSLFERMAERGDAFASDIADQLVGEMPDLVPAAKFYMAKDADQ